MLCNHLDLGTVMSSDNLEELSEGVRGLLGSRPGPDASRGRGWSRVTESELSLDSVVAESVCTTSAGHARMRNERQSC